MKCPKCKTVMKPTGIKNPAAGSFTVTMPDDRKHPEKWSETYKCPKCGKEALKYPKK